MKQEQKKKLIRELVVENNWKDVLARFINVLKINIILVDFEGQMVLPPVYDRYGWKFFEKRCLGKHTEKSHGGLLKKFQKDGDYLECRYENGLQCFATPIYNESNAVMAYLIVGPVILNKKEESAFYEEISRKNKIDLKELLGTINSVRVVSHITMKSILDLLSKVTNDVIELNLEKKKLSTMQVNQKDISQEISKVAQDIYSSIHTDELLITFLDIALKMTNTECGSIMVIDDSANELYIKVSRGIKEERIQNTRLKVGEGIAGLAVSENSSFVIHGKEGESRIKPLLNRDEIKHSIIMPLTTKNKVFGVLNLHTKEDRDGLEEGYSNLQYLTRLVSAACQTI